PEAVALLADAHDDGIEFAFTWPGATGRVLGDALVRAGQPHEATRRYQEALAICDAGHAALESARAHLGLAHAALDLGERGRRRPARPGGAVGETPAPRPRRARGGALPRRSMDAHGVGATEAGFMVILITDVVGSTDVSVTLGDIAYHRLVTEHHRLVREQ